MSISFRFFVFLTFFVASIQSAFADGGRQVTRTYYDGMSRAVKVQVFDDVGHDAQLVSESETEYDQLNNVTRQLQKRIQMDQDGDGALEPVIAGYSEIESRAAYEDENWPTRITHIYNPRWSSLNEDEQRRRAQQVWYVENIQVNGIRKNFFEVRE